VARVSDPASPIRSLYLEGEAGIEGVDFEATYEYTVEARRPLARYEGRCLIGEVPEGLSPFLEEQPPHVAFEPELRELVGGLTSGETDAAVVARRLYDWIAENVLYSYAREYSVIRNLSLSTFQRSYGDCGEMAMLYITLCRIAGIPARWQSGWWDPPGKRNMHDWTEVYLHPLGWLPVDPYMGVWAARYAEALSEEDRDLVRDFYFGNMDHFRLYVNGAHMQPLDPPKQHFRSEPVDFQRGEVEWEGGNIYYDSSSSRLVEAV
jgi:transglutaminase-like putative cysteine protease